MCVSIECMYYYVFDISCCSSVFFYSRVSQAYAAETVSLQRPYDSIPSRCCCLDGLFLLKLFPYVLIGTPHRCSYWNKSPLLLLGHLIAVLIGTDLHCYYWNTSSLFLLEHLIAVIRTNPTVLIGTPHRCSYWDRSPLFLLEHLNAVLIGPIC